MSLLTCAGWRPIIAVLMRWAISHASHRVPGSTPHLNGLVSHARFICMVDCAPLPPSHPLALALGSNYLYVFSSLSPFLFLFSSPYLSLSPSISFYLFSSSFFSLSLSVCYTLTVVCDSISGEHSSRISPHTGLTVFLCQLLDLNFVETKDSLVEG